MVLISTCIRFSHLSRNMVNISRIKDEELSKPNRFYLVPYANNNIMINHFTITQCMNNEENKGTSKELIAHCQDGHLANVEEDGNRTVGEVDGDGDACRTAIVCSGGSTRKITLEEYYAIRASCIPISYQNGLPRGEPHPTIVFPNSTHRDGSIYRGIEHWKTEYHIADRNETRLEAMMLSDPDKNCIKSDGTCYTHTSCPIMQIFSLKLAKIFVDSGSGSVELYGYIAARDLMDPLPNYVVNISRDDPITLEQGSLIEMTGPKRGIDLSRTVLIEYDLRIKAGEQEKDDLQLIDGVSLIDEQNTHHGLFKNRIYGKSGLIDITHMCIESAMQASVEVVISEVKSSFDLCLSCFTSGVHEEIRLFDGAINESHGLRRKHLVAVNEDACMDLKFKAGLGPYCCSFKASNHGCARQQIKMEFASILVNVTWGSVIFDRFK